MQPLMMFRTTVLAAALCVAAASCGIGGNSPLGGTWTVIAAGDVRIESKLEAPRLQFAVDGTLRGSTGCTDFTVTASVIGESIEIGLPSIRSTTTCSARAREIEAAMMAALRQATHLSGGLPSDRLRLSGGGGDLVLAQPAPSFPGDPH